MAMRTEDRRERRRFVSALSAPLPSGSPRAAWAEGCLGWVSVTAASFAGRLVTLPNVQQFLEDRGSGEAIPNY